MSEHTKHTAETSLPKNEGRLLMISGLVQGVGYRWSMVQQASRLGVRGWVRNRLDGRVEALIAGAAEDVAALLVWAQEGPLGASVEHIQVDFVADHALPQSLAFEQLPTV